MSAWLSSCQPTITFEIYKAVGSIRKAEAEKVHSLTDLAIHTLCHVHWMSFSSGDLGLYFTSVTDENAERVDLFG